MSHKPSDGEYWVVPVGSEWAVFWHHPAHPHWHYMLARFDTEQRARDYAEIENDCLLDGDEKYPVDPAQAPTVAPAITLRGIGPSGAVVTPLAIPAPRARAGFAALVDFGNQLLEDLPNLFASHPDGLTVSHIRERYKASYNAACEAMRWVAMQEKGRWVHRRGQGGPKVLLPPTSTFQPDDLTEYQRRIMETLTRIKDANDCASATPAEIARGAGIPGNTGVISGVLYSLTRKGYLMEARPAVPGKKPPVYQILKQLEREPCSST